MSLIISAEWNLPLLSIGPLHFCFKGFWMVIFTLINILIEHSITKLCRLWSDAAFCSVWSWSAMYVDIPKKGHFAYYIGLCMVRRFSIFRTYDKILSSYQKYFQWLKKCYTHQRATTGSSSDSLQLRPLLKREFILKERICSQRKRILSLKSSSFMVWKITFTTSGDLPWMLLFFIYTRA